MRSVNNDSLLLELIHDGNEHAFEITFLKYYEPLCKYSWKYVRTHDIAEEVVQEVFASIWENRGKLDQWDI